MIFQTQYKRISRIFTNAGSPFMDKYSPKVDKNGHTYVVKTGKTNMHELIQADKDSVDFNLIIKRYQAGDLSAIDKIKAVYLDTTDFPTSYPDLLNRIIQCNQMFDNLPVEIKQQFDNSPDVFWTGFGNEHFLEVFGLSKRTPVETEPIVPEPETLGGDE